MRTTPVDGIPAQQREVGEEAAGYQSEESLGPQDTDTNRELYCDLQRLHEGRYATTSLPRFDGAWIVFAVPFLE